MTTRNVLSLLLAVLLTGSLFACAPAASAAEPAISEATAEPIAADPVEAAKTADELNALIEQYRSAGDFDGIYRAALKLTDLEPDNAAAYIAAAGALLAVNEQNEQEMKRILALGLENAPDSADMISAWLGENGLSGAVETPFMPDYADASQINTEGNTVGNLTSAMKRNDTWMSGLVTSQAGWVYFSRADMDYALYKMRADGSELRALSNVHASSLNVAGDWLYFCNFDDAKCPYRMRTDGSGLEKLADFSCSFLSVSGDWIYCDDSGYESIRLTKLKTDGSEQTVLYDGPVIFCCAYGGYVYFNIKSMEEGGFLRISTDGADKKQLLTDMPSFYCIENGRIYFTGANGPNTVRSMNLDGSDAADVFRADDTITALNLSGDYLILAKGISDDNDGFTMSRSIQIVRMDTGEIVREWEAATEPLCVAEGLLFYTVDKETMEWHCVSLETFEEIPTK